MSTDLVVTLPAPMKREQVLWALRKVYNLDAQVAADVERSIEAWHARRKAVERECNELRAALVEVTEALNERWGPISTSIAYLVKSGRLAVVDDNGYRVPTNQERSDA